MTALEIGCLMVLGWIIVGSWIKTVGYIVADVAKLKYKEEIKDEK